MHTTESVVVPAAADEVFPFVATLDRYPIWLPLVHVAVEDEPDGDRPAWLVELRARVGPFARSKRLRMVRTVCEPPVLVVFEREETSRASHSAWMLRVELEPGGGAERATLVTMHLTYGGRLWTAGALDRVLDEEVRRGRTGLVDAVNGAKR